MILRVKSEKFDYDLGLTWVWFEMDSGHTQYQTQLWNFKSDLVLTWVWLEMDSGHIQYQTQLRNFKSDLGLIWDWKICCLFFVSADEFLGLTWDWLESEVSWFVS